MQLAVLVSGSGTLLEAMISADLPVRLVVADRECRGLAVAQRAQIPTELVERTDFGSSFDREGYGRQLCDTLDRHDIDLVAMAGFGTILGEVAFDRFAGRILNTHPALLPSFPGWHAVRDALAAGVHITGCTIHVATAQVDSGPILAQVAVPVRADDDEATLHERIKTVERQLYITTLAAVLAAGRVDAKALHRRHTHTPDSEEIS